MAKKTLHPEFDSPSFYEEDGCRYMHFASPWLQGAMDLEKPHLLCFEYVQQLCAWLLFLEPSKNKELLILGLGAGSLVRFFEHYSCSRLLVIEWNPQVTALCEFYFNVIENDRVKIIHEDAEYWVQKVQNRKTAQVLMVDLYNYEAEGPVCDSLEFYKGCKNTLGEIGIATFNLFGHHHSFIKNYEYINHVFEDRVLIFNQTKDGNQIVIGFKGPKQTYSLEELSQRANDIERHYQLPAKKFLDELRPQLEKYYRIKNKAQISFCI